MKNIIFVFLSASLVSSLSLAAANSCAAIAGVYKGTCTTHWQSGDYQASANASIWQAPNGVPRTGLAQASGCGPLQFTLWSTDNKGAMTVLANKSFSIYGPTLQSSIETVSVDRSLTTTQGQWSIDGGQFIISTVVQGHEDDGVTPYTTSLTTTLSKKGSRLLIKTTGTGSYVIPSDCTFDLEK